jgi:hypothetical protein
MARWYASAPRSPLKEDGWWVSMIINDEGDEWPTGMIHQTREDALEHARKTAAEWTRKDEQQAKSHDWWKFWSRT